MATSEERYDLGLAQVKPEGFRIMYDRPPVLDFNRLDHVMIKLIDIGNEKRRQKCEVQSR